ncbi:hypothetical protein NLG97_g10710 [Lecanicillium saksenae]|uniref:Uncharacterized protein n=1 Tax=Lecanicillium saksenae TaxID=468837 RepID=A0ACC1QDR3_9HYPO|nr:hypothetical protein NLG97_g10710 [Lecanicillium saksenae]
MQRRQGLTLLPDPKPVADFLKASLNNPRMAPPVEDEDCLYLNVYSPATASPSDKKPVLFWIFGGNLMFGGSTLAFYDGSFFAGLQDVVVVTINYRTNIFGFPGAPHLPPGEQNVVWRRPRADNLVRRVCWGCVREAAARVPTIAAAFRAAILESQGAVLPAVPELSYGIVAKNFGCTDPRASIDCLRQVPAADLASFISKHDIFFPPRDDHATWTSDVRPRIRSKEFADVPLFFGSNSDEGRLFVAALGLANASANVDNLAFLIPDQQARTAMHAFYNPFIRDTYHLLSTIITKLLFTCKTSSLSSYAKSHGYNVWRYYFSFQPESLVLFPDSGAYHASEVPFVFGSLPLYEGVATATKTETALSHFMQTTWANFAKNPSSGPGWQQIHTTPKAIAELGGKHNSTGKYMISPIEIENDCFLYNPIIDLTGY